MKQKVLTGAVFVAGVAVLVVAAFNSWPHLSAWYVLQTEFKRVSKPGAEVREYRHNETGIVFAIEGAEK